MIQVQLIHTYVKTVELDLPIGADSFDIKEAVQKLTLDDFADDDAWQSVRIFKNDKDITHEVQPLTSHLNP